MIKEALILALDSDDKKEALKFVQQTKDYIGTYKIGPRLFLREGAELIKQIKEISPSCKIFLDFKFYDIPSSTVSAVNSAFEVGAHFVTVHASVGLQTLKLLSQLENRLEKNQVFKVLCVTVLSSVAFSEQTQSKVIKLADEVYQSGLKSLVCSPHEAKLLKSKCKDFFLVTPGIRLEEDDCGDQKRTMTPELAIKEGSSALVVGRSVTHSENPVEKLKKIHHSLSSDALS